MEGPSLVILAEELSTLKNRIITNISGNTKTDKERLVGKKILDIFPYGKYLNVQVKNFGFRAHFLMFGSYRLDERRGEMTPRLSLSFSNRELNLYNCSIKFLEGQLRDNYDFRFDIMAKEWDKKTVARRLKDQGDEQLGDALLDQEIFAGVGNIIKNEVLFRCRLHPETLIKELNQAWLTKLIKETRDYSLLFYELKKQFILKKNFQIYRKSYCPNCGHPVTHAKTGKRERMSHYCPICQPKSMAP